MKMEGHQRKNVTMKKIIPIILIATVTISCIVALLVVFFKPNTDYQSAEDKNINITSLYCKSTNTASPFFESDEATSISQEIKITFEESVPENISYVFTGTYKDSESATKARGNAEYKYGTYMNSKGVERGTLSENFANIDNVSRVSIIGDKKTLNSITGPMFFLDESIVKKYSKLTNIDFQKIYQNIGFSCKINN